MIFDFPCANEGVFFETIAHVQDYQQNKAGDILLFEKICGVLLALFHNPIAIISNVISP